MTVIAHKKTLRHRRRQKACAAATFGTKAAIEIDQMTRKIATLACAAFLVIGCSRSGKVQRSQQQYQTVQEGSASGVTSTINAPGETAPPLTNTNVDTTTNFTLPNNPNPLGNATDGSMASAMPPSYPAGTPGMPPAARPRTAPRAAPAANAPVVTDTIGSTTPAMPRERAPQPPQRDRQQTDTAATDRSAPPPQTDTAMTDTSSTASTSTATDAKKKKDDGKKQDSDQTDPPPPPPPTATDTRG
jgi:hypothetical protein